MAGDNLKIEIRRNNDCKIATIFNDHAFDESYQYLWEEGNYACDCNRHDFFCDALGIPASEVKCGEDEYSVRITDNKTGKILYEEV